MYVRFVALLIGSIVWLFAVIAQFRLTTTTDDKNSTSSFVERDEPAPRSRAGADPSRSGELAATPPPPPPPPPPPKPRSERFTSHWCHSRDFLWDNSHRASCLFHDLCVVQRPPDSKRGNKRHEVEFLYVHEEQSDVSREEVERRRRRVLDGDASFTLGIGPHNGDERLIFRPVPVSMSEIDKLYPVRNYVEGTSVLYYEYNSENFGHLISDQLIPIYAALEGFGLENREDVTLFRYSIMDAIGWSCDYHRRVLEPEGGISPRYGNIGKHCDRFYEMTPEFMRGHRPLQVLNGTTVEPTCFRNLVAGMPMYSDDCDGDSERDTNYWSLCNQGRQGQFWRFRNYVLRNVLGGSDADVERYVPTRHKIAVTYRNDDVRGLTNLDELIDRLREKYGDDDDVEVVVVEWAKLSVADQMELIRTTTVHVTPPGGVSFIAIFLPRWATSIRLYSMEYRMEWNFFHYLGYISVEHVNCQNAEKIPLRETLQLVEEGLRRYEYHRVGSGDGGWTPPSKGGVS